MGRILSHKAPGLTKYGHFFIYHRNGFDEVDGKTQLHSRDFSKVDSTYLDDYTNNASFALKTTEITTTKKVFHYSKSQYFFPI